MVHHTERQPFRIVWRQESESTFQKQKANEAAIEARIAAQRHARLAAQVKQPAPPSQASETPSQIGGSGTKKDEAI